MKTSVAMLLLTVLAVRTGFSQDAVAGMPRDHAGADSQHQGGALSAPWQSAAMAGVPPVQNGEVFGTSSQNSTIIGAEDFQTTGDDQFAISLGPGHYGNRYRTAGTSGLLMAHVVVPNGARITGITLWASDYSASGEVKWSLSEVDMSAKSGTILGEGGTGVEFSDGSFGAFQPLTYPYLYSSHTRRLILSVTLTQMTFGVAINGVTVWWTRQVSPPPAIATFSDVPTSHPFFQFVEALNASGITAGTGGGNFSPDAPVTRGQMAVFLAKALGLHWGY